MFQPGDEEAPLSGEDSDDVPEEAEEPMAPPAGAAPELGHFGKGISFSPELH